MPRKTDFTPSSVLSFLAAAVVTFDVSPKILAQTATVARWTSIKTKLGGFVEL
jgi:hypothetical protein